MEFDMNQGGAVDGIITYPGYAFGNSLQAATPPLQERIYISASSNTTQATQANVDDQ